MLGGRFLPGRTENLAGEKPSRTGSGPGWWGVFLSMARSVYLKSLGRVCWHIQFHKQFSVNFMINLNLLAKKKNTKASNTSEFDTKGWSERHHQSTPSNQAMSSLKPRQGVRCPGWSLAPNPIKRLLATSTAVQERCQEVSSRCSSYCSVTTWWAKLD